MGTVSVRDVVVTPLKQIATPGGDVWHGLKSSEPTFAGFGEAYFSWVADGAIKAWKRHLRMTMNLVVPVGLVRFVFSDDGATISRVVDIGAGSYARITVPPGLWFGFQGHFAPESLVLNIASIPHDPSEVERRNPSELDYDWNER